MNLKVSTVELHPTVAESIRKHAQQQADKGGYEAVGFVAVSDRDITEGKTVGTATVPMNNHAANPQEAFFVESWEQFQAERKLAEDGYEIVGVYHSHVNSEALPSMSDHKMARPNEYVFIYSVVFGELKAYKENGGTLEPVDLEIKEA